MSMSITYKKILDHDELFGVIKKTFPALQDVAMAVETTGKGSFVLSIDTREVSPRDLKQLIDAMPPMPKPQLEEAEQEPEAPDEPDEPGQDTATDVVFDGAGDTDDTGVITPIEAKILQAVRRVPGVEGVVMAAVAVMSETDARIQEKTEEILGCVATLETSVVGITATIAGLCAKFEALVLQMAESKQDISEEVNTKINAAKTALQRNIDNVSKGERENKNDLLEVHRKIESMASNLGERIGALSAQNEFVTKMFASLAGSLDGIKDEQAKAEQAKADQAKKEG